MSRWWPREYTWSGDGLEDIGIERGEEGRCFERGPHGLRYDWGRVIDWDPPGRLVFTWQIGPDRVPVPDPEGGSEVEVRFRASPDGEATTVTLEHRGFHRHGEGADAYRAGMGSEEGWPFILARFRESAG